MDLNIQELQPRPLADFCAGRISDPILRLRFLRSMAPAPETPLPWRPPRLRYLAAPLLLLLLLSCLLLRTASRAGERPVLPAAAVEPEPAGGSSPPEVWLVEQNGSSETFSNGLRIDNRFAISNHARSYIAFPADDPSSGGVARTQPAGIVFHTTESRQAPFEARENGVLKRIGESLAEYVRRKHAYNFLIDRFGRVYRIVAEGDAANHAGNSVWADDQWLYINLNESFLGVSIEAETQPGQTESPMSPAQRNATRMLTEMLRSRYAIAAVNCVTHGQVSVNPANMLAGYHTDWASSFPFTSLGLPDNYSRPLPALDVFGFEADPAFLRSTGPRMAASVNFAEDALFQEAEAAGVSPRAYRRGLQKRYRARLETMRHWPAEDSEEQ